MKTFEDKQVWLLEYDEKYENGNRVGYKTGYLIFDGD
jgi:hypothetical protein